MKHLYKCRFDMRSRQKGQGNTNWENSYLTIDVISSGDAIEAARKAIKIALKRKNSRDVRVFEVIRISRIDEQPTTLKGGPS